MPGPGQPVSAALRAADAAPVFGNAQAARSDVSPVSSSQQVSEPFPGLTGGLRGSVR